MADTQIYGTLCTDIGNAAIANSVLTGAKVNFTQIAVGDADGTPYAPVSGMTALKHQVWSGAIAEVAQDPEEANRMILHAVLPSSVGGWVMREIGVLDDQGRLIALGNTPEIPKESVTSGAIMEMDLYIYISVVDARGVNVVIDPTVVIASKADVNKLRQLLDAHTSNSDVHIASLTCTTSGTVHALTGLSASSGLVSCVFKADADYAEGDTFTVDGTAVTAQLQNGDALESGYFKSGAVVPFVYDIGGAKLNFKKGGSYGTLAAQINNFYATIGDASVRLTWSNPSDGNYAGVAIVRKTGGYPSKVLDGTKIYEGSGTSVTDTGLANGTQYFYRAFAYNSKHEYQTEYCVATMTPLQGYQLGTFPVGTRLKFGSIFGNPIVMKIANISGNNVTLITDGIIARYAFDAKEPSNGDSNRQSYGNNRYVLSNIHQWLNSEAGAGSWYVAQHGADQPPDSTSVVSENPYKSAAGFLNGFSTKEKNYLKTQTVTVGKSNTDGGGTEALNARVWLPSETEVGLQTDFVEGSQLQAFSDNNSRVAYETADCAAHTGGTAGGAWYYWLRTPYPSSSYYVRGVNSVGMLNSDSACNGSGVRPLCVLDSSVLISLTPDASGAYTIL